MFCRHLGESTTESVAARSSDQRVRLRRFRLVRSKDLDVIRLELAQDAEEPQRLVVGLPAIADGIQQDVPIRQALPLVALRGHAVSPITDGEEPGFDVASVRVFFTPRYTGTGFYSTDQRAANSTRHSPAATE